MADNQQPEAEVQAQVGSGSNGEFALAWVGLIVDQQDWHGAMRVMTDELRRGHAESWATQAQETGELLGHDPAAVVAALDACDDTHPCWRNFSVANVAHYAYSFGPRGSISMGTRPRPVGVDSELFVFVDYNQIPGDEVTIQGVPRRVVHEPTQAIAEIEVQTTDSGPRVSAVRFSQRT